MNKESIFEAALAMNSPWYIDTIKFDDEQKRLDIFINFERGSRSESKNPEYPGEFKACDTKQKQWRHLLLGICHPLHQVPWERRPGLMFDKLKSRYVFRTTLTLESGLHIGGGKLSPVTGSDSPVMKDYEGFQFCRKPTDLTPAVLISTLGESPGVVTSAVHYYEKIRQELIRFERVVVVAPNNDEIRCNCYDLLQRQPCLKNRLSYKNFEAYDVKDQNDLKVFMKKMKDVVKECINDGHQIYLNLAGGRKVMSGALLLLAQLYHIKEIFHLSILDDHLDQEIEQYGEWRKLNTLKHDNPEKYDRILYPDKVTAVVLRPPNMLQVAELLEPHD